MKRARGASLIIGHLQAGKVLRVCDADIFPTTPPGSSQGLAQAAWARRWDVLWTAARQRSV